jgi:hypothetical protein
LLQTSNGVKDRFIEHALIYALISINQPALTEKGLADASADIKRAALIALDQMKASTLKVNQVTPLLTHQDSILQHTALWVVSHHPDWAKDMTAYLKTQMAKTTLAEEDQRRLKEILISFSGSTVTQDFIARQMTASSAEKKSFMIDVMGGL